MSLFSLLKIFHFAVAFKSNGSISFDVSNVWLLEPLENQSYLDA